MVDDPRKEEKQEKKRLQDGTNFKGGKQSKRDREFWQLKDDPEFNEWYHRKGKRLVNGNRNIPDQKTADKIYQDYLDGLEGGRRED